MSTISPPTPADAAYVRDLPDGLRLRWSTPADVDRLADLYSEVMRDRADDPPNTAIAAWTRDMMSGRHPLIGPGDFALVEDRQTGTIVAATCLLRQTWAVGGIPVPVGRPEIVATRSPYRRRGLIRAIFDLIHARSQARGDLVQGITGISYFYRQFGYEYALELENIRRLPFTAIPTLKLGAAEPASLRDATAADLPQLLALYARERSASFVSTLIDADYWRYVLEDMTPESREGWRTQLIADGAGATVGYVLTRRMRWGPSIPVCGLAVDQGVSLVAVLPSVLRALQPQAADLFSSKRDLPPPSSIALDLGATHPVFDVLGPRLPPPKDPPYAWYVRVPDLPGFIRHIAPVLEARLAGSAFAGHSGDLRIDFFRAGLRLVFEAGRLTAAEPWRAPEWEPAATCSFPPLTFLHLLFGHRSRAELRHIYSDVWANDETLPLLDILFPRLLSRVLSLE